MKATRHMGRLSALGVGGIVALSAVAGSAHATPRPGPPLRVARAVIRATDGAPVVEVRDGRVIDGHPVYLSYTDRGARITAAYLAGKLVQGTVGSTLYAVSGRCFERKPLADAAAPRGIAVGLLPLPSITQRVSYKRSGRTLSWREPADREHSAERGDVRFNARGRIVRSDRASYTSGRTTVAAETTVLSYPSRLPRFVPTSLPRPACKPSAEENAEKFAPEGGENHRSHAS